MVSIAYGNKHTMIRFDVTICESVVEELIDYGSLDEDFEFDFEVYYDETDSDYVQEMASPILDAIIDYYTNKTETFADELTDEEIRMDEWARVFAEEHELYQIIMWNDIYCPFMDKYGNYKLVEITEVDPERPYGWM